MAFLTDETQGFDQYFSRAVPEHVVDVQPHCLTDTPGTYVQPADPAAAHASVCVVEVQRPAERKSEASTAPESSGSFFDGRSYICARASLADDAQRSALDKLAGQTLTLYLVCVRAQGTRAYYQAHADFADSTPSTFRLALRAASTAPPPASGGTATGYPAVPGIPAAYPPSAGPRYQPPAGPYFHPPPSSIPAVAHQHPHPPGTPYPPAQTLNIAAIPAYPYDSSPYDRPPNQGCSWSLNWTLFCLGFLFPPLWIVAMIRGSGMFRGIKRTENAAAAASFFALLFYIAVWVPLYWRYK